ncbi:MAG: RMD1 family protein [Pseudomonadota bacterium]
MQSKAFCTADSYQMSHLYKYFKKEDYKLKKFPDVFYTPVNNGHAFFFSYGCVVFWELSDDEINSLLQKIKNFENDHLPKPNSDSYFIVKGETNKVYQNEIYLTSESGIKEKLAISYALAQSMKLAVFEERVEQTIKKTEYIPKSLAKNGRIPLSGKQIAQKMGKLFIDRSSINLHSDILDTPEYFWDNPELEPIYHMAAKDQDIKQRVDILNKRLNLVHELFEMLSDVFNSRHSSFLEIIIIILISIEIVLTIGFKIVK